MIDYDNLDLRNLAVHKLDDLGEIPDELAEKIVNVRPMPAHIMRQLLQNTKSENDLIREGYEPVSRFKLLWIKK